MIGPFQENTIVVGDCLDIMKQMPDECVDLVVADPPYNIGKAEWDDIEEYILWSAGWLREALRILTFQGSIYVCSSQRWMPYLFIELDRMAIWQNTIVWHYTNGLGSNRHYSMRYEPLLFFTKTTDYYFDIDALRTKDWAHGRGCEKGYHPKGRNPTDVWHIHRLVWNNLERVDHPTQKPVKLFGQMIMASCPIRGMVFDPFIGSGTTAVAADRLGRKWFGCDISSLYVSLALERIEADRLKRSQLEMSL